MLQSGMRRFLLLLIAFCLPALSALAQTNIVAHGLIVQLKPAAKGLDSRELPSADPARRELAAQERMSVVRQGAGIVSFSHRHLSGEHRLMRFAHALQGTELEDTMRRLRLHPDVASVEPNVRLRPMSTPNDPLFAQQWHLASSALAANAAALNMTRTWSVTTGTAMTVAVVDTGVRYGHPDLAGRLLPGYDFIEDVANANDGDGRDADASDPGDWVTADDRKSGLFAGCEISDSLWHGTFIAGQIASASNNALGVTGMNWNARILPVRVSGKCGALLSDILDGIRWAVGLTVPGVPANPNPARIVNLSFGGDQPCSSSYQSVIDEMATVGALLVVAAGNSQGSGDNMQLKRPADCRGVLAVGAAQANGLKTGYSYIGSTMAVMAPGGDGSIFPLTTQILSTDNAGAQGPGADSYGHKSGTSFSAPLAAGAASLMLAINPALTPDALVSRLKAAAGPHVFVAGYPSCSMRNQVACNCTTTLCGAGLLDPTAAALSAYAPAAVIAPVPAPATGASLQLNGQSSAAVGTSTIASYRWSQLTGSIAVLNNTTNAIAQVVLPNFEDRFVFRLTVTDSLGRTGFADLDFTSIAPVSNSGGGGADHAAWLVLVAAVTGFMALRRFARATRPRPSRVKR